MSGINSNLTQQQQQQMLLQGNSGNLTPPSNTNFTFTTLNNGVVLLNDADPNHPLVPLVPDNTLVIPQLPSETSPIDWIDVFQEFPNGFPDFIFVQGANDTESVIYQNHGSGSTFRYNTGYRLGSMSGINTQVAAAWNSDNGLGSTAQDFASYNMMRIRPNGTGVTFNETVELPVGSQPPGSDWNFLGTQSFPTGSIETTQLPAGQAPPDNNWTAGALLQNQPTGTFEFQTLPQGIDPGNGWMMTGQSSETGTGNWVTQNLIAGSQAPDGWQFVKTVTEGPKLTLSPTETPPDSSWVLVDTIEGNTSPNIIELPAGSEPPAGYVLKETIEKPTGQFETKTVGPNDTPPPAPWQATGETEIIGWSMSGGGNNSIGIGTNIDGTVDSGFYGQWLQSNSVDDPDYLINLLENSNNIENYRVSGLFETNNNVSITADNQVVDTNVADGIQGDKNNDGFLAGDPWIGSNQNGYARTQVTPSQTGYFTFHEDYAEDGSGWEVVDHIQVINAEGNIANTGYGFIVTDQSGDKTNVSVEGGVTTIHPADGSQSFTFQDNGSGTPHVILDDNGRELAKFYYADMPGGEQSGSLERRLVAEKYEYPSDRVTQELLAQGVPQSYIDNLVNKDQMTLGFRIPDGNGSFRSSNGVADGQSPLLESNTVKTYYDVHLDLGGTNVLDVNVCRTPTPIHGDIYKKEIVEMCDVYEEHCPGDQHIYQQSFDVYKQEETSTTVEWKKETLQDIQVWERPEMIDKDVWERTVEENEADVDLYSPLIGDLDGDGKLTGNYPVYVDLNGDDVTDIIRDGWSPKDAVAVFDANGDGQAGYVNGELTALELFGNVSDTDGDNNPNAYANGFEALKSLAEQHLGAEAIADGVLGPEEMAAINNATGFGFLVDGQYRTAEEIGIRYINLNYTEEDRPDGLGNSINQHSTFIDRDGNSGIFSDVWFPLEEAPVVNSLDAMNFISTQNQSQVNQSSQPSVASNSTNADELIANAGQVADPAAQSFAPRRPEMILPSMDPNGIPVSSVMDIQPFQMMFMQIILRFLMQMMTMGPPNYYPPGMPNRFFVSNNRAA